MDPLTLRQEGVKDPPSPRRRGFSLIHLNIPVAGWNFTSADPSHPAITVTPASPQRDDPPRKFSFANLRRLSASVSRVLCLTWRELRRLILLPVVQFDSFSVLVRLCCTTFHLGSFCL